MGDHERRLIDRRVSEIRHATESEGWEFQIVDESPTFVTYETRPSKGSMWRKVVVSVDDDGEVRVEEDLPESLAASWRRKSEESDRSFEAKWVARHSDLIASLEEGGHSLSFKTVFDKSYFMYMRCERCGAGDWGRRSERLSPERRCEGERDKSAYDVRWAARRSALISALEEVGHAPRVTTEWDRARYSTGMRCDRCGASRGLPISAGKRLSPRRPCSGSA